MSKELAGCAALLALGTLEGYAFIASGMFPPAVILDQMKFRRFVVMKLFLSAVGSSMVFQSIMSKISKEDFEKSRFYTRSTVGVMRSAGGCALLGVGMAIAGSGPSLIPTQIAGVADGYNVLIGAMIGGALYSLVEPRLPAPSVPKDILGIDEMLKVPYAKVAVPFGLTLLGAAYGFELLFPHASDVVGLGIHTPWLNPIVAGCVIGMNQIPIRFITADGQGGSTSVMSIVNMLSLGKLAKRSAVKGFASLYQFFYMYGGTLLGAYVALQSAGGSPAPNFSCTRRMLGGALMLIGARFANGCTCGHGISGFSELSTVSIAAACSIFGGGMFAGLFL
eukprot:PhM_4_TR15822/c0_g1_i1/m.22142